MTANYLNIDYLKEGTPIQKKVYKRISKHNVLEKLEKYNPIVVGTYPLDINIESSDIDIIGQTNNFIEAVDDLIKKFSEYHNFSIRTTEKNHKIILVCSFWIKKFRFEVYLENKNPLEQSAYKHMLTEAKILKSKDELFKKEIINLKNKGISTEEAFALLLGLEGDPYEMLLNFEV